MNNKYHRMVMICCLLATCGCHSRLGSSSPAENHVKNERELNKPQPVKQDEARKNISHLVQCNRDLESLRTVDATQYRHFQIQYDALVKNSEGFLTVKDEVSPEVAALARPRFQFALVNLCYRIKDALAKTLIMQAGGGV